MEAILSTAASRPSLPLALDHLVVAARSLDEGEAWLAQRIGQPLAAGGAHPGFGTHNRLLRLGASSYLELIAPDPAQAVRRQLFGLDQAPVAKALAAGPVLLHVVFRVLAPATLEEVLPRLAYDPGLPTAMTRGELRWRMTVLAGGGLAGGGLLPTIIDWGNAAHPCTRLPESGVTLDALRLAGPRAVIAAFPAMSPPPSSALVPTIHAASCSTICAEFLVGARTIIIESVLPDRDLR
ncbi:MAG: VOC family protein [Lautropia sp.]|nr:VOC family protein [Lautropia sp.]